MEIAKTVRCRVLQTTPDTPDWRSYAEPEYHPIEGARDSKAGSAKNSVLNGHKTNIRNGLEHG